MDIKAIETQYKGYRFRSRLEARWAVFFDALGVEWEYETNGFEDGETRYLPDFYIPYSNTYVEIKPFSDYVPFSVMYLAGKIRSEGDWREDFELGLEQKFEKYGIIGPGYMPHDATCEDLVSDCLDLIDSSNLIYARLDNPNTPGTLVELGYAHAKNKKIIVWFSTEEIRQELYFVASMPGITYSVGGDEYKDLYGLLVPISETYKRCRMLSRDKNNKVILMQGDPGRCSNVIFNRGYECDWKTGYLNRICEIWINPHKSESNFSMPRQLFDNAVKKSRSARFEFGEQG